MAIHQTTPALITGTQDFFTTTTSAQINVGDTVINLNAAPTATEGILIIDPNNPATREIIYFNSKSGTQVTCPDATVNSGRGLGGTSVQQHASGVLVEMRWTAEHMAELANGNANLGLANYLKSAGPTYVVSGLVLTSSSGFNISMSSGVAYINGKRFSINSAAFTGVTVNDSYFDIKENGDGTTTVVQANVANNAASPAIATNSDSSAALRIGIVAMAAGALATGGINQGNPAAVLPIASSVAYSVTDSLGNLIYPCTPNPTLIGYRQITSNFTAGSSTASITGLVAPCIIPVGRRVKVTLFTFALSYGNADVSLSTWDGVPFVGTNIGGGESSAGSGTGIKMPMTLPSFPPGLPSGLKTYQAGCNTSGAVVSASATTPAFLSIELV